MLNKIAGNTLFIVIMCVGYMVGYSTTNANIDTFEYNIKLPKTNETSRFIQYKANKYEPIEWSNADHNKEVHCLALNIYFEARNQPKAGQLAVGLVTLNRVLSKKFPNTICEVVWQQKQHPTTKKMVPQFSWTLDGKKDKPLDIKTWNKNKQLAAAMIAGHTFYNFYDITEGSTHFHANYVDPFWSKHYKLNVVIGDHMFYSDKRYLPVAFLNRYGV